MIRAFLSCFIIFGALALLSPSATAQTLLPNGDGGTVAAPELPDPLTPEAVREMVSRLSDAEVRALLLDRLDSVARAQSAEGTEVDSASLLEFTQTAVGGFFGSIAVAVERIPLLWDSQITSFRNFGDRLGSGGISMLLTVLIGAVIGGLLVEWIFLRLTDRWHPRTAGAETEQSTSLMGSVKFLFSRFCRDIAGVIIFYFAAQFVGQMIAFKIFAGRPEIELIGPYALLIWTNLIVLPRIGAAISRFILAPNRPEVRIVHTDDHTARFLHRNQIGMFLLMGFSIAIVVFNDLNGVAVGVSRLGFWLNLAVHAYIIIIAWKARDGLVMMMRGADPDVTVLEERVARAYPWFGIGVSVATWVLVNILASYELFALLQTAPHYKMMFLLLMAPALDTLVRGLVRHMVPPMTGAGTIAEQAYRATKRSYIRIGRVLVFAMVVLIIARIWGIDFHNVAAAGVGAQVAGRLFEILIILAVGYLLWELFSLWLNRKLASEHTAGALDTTDEELGAEGGGAGGSRLSTVLPLLLGVAKVTFAVIVGLIALGNIGIDITPLLAGAGIAGLAIGFGAQKLVTDVVSGIFFLVDDAFRTGEFVEVDGTVGTVEKISIRSMQLRHHKGPVHTIPYGEIPKLTNYSRDWVIMKLKFTVPFETDPNKVKKLFKQIGKEMMEVPEFANDLLQPFKSQGVFDFDDVGMIIRGKFMAKPGRQFVLRKEIYNRVKKAFEENAISFARREVRVAIPGIENANLTEDQKTSVAAAAGQAVQDSLPQTSGPASDDR